MSQQTNNFTAVGAGSTIKVKRGDSLSYSLSGTFGATVKLQKNVGSGAWKDVPGMSFTAATNGTLTKLDAGSYRWFCSAFTSGTAVAQISDAVSDTEAAAALKQGDIATLLGAINPAAGLSVEVERVGPFYRMVFNLNAVALTVTDAAGSGSSASLKIFDFVQAGINVLSCRQNYTAFAEGAALTGAAGDAAFVMGLGSVAANAGDGALTGTEVDFGSVTGTITLAAGTGAGTKFSAGLGALDGTTTAVDLYLNWSGTAATIDANSTISVTGTVELLVNVMGDD